MNFNWYKILDLKDEKFKNENFALYLDDFFKLFNFCGYDDNNNIIVNRNNQKYYVNFDGNKLYLRAKKKTHLFEELIVNELYAVSYYDCLEFVYKHNYKFYDKENNSKKIIKLKSDYVKEDSEYGFVYIQRIDILNGNDKFLYPSVVCGSNVYRKDDVTYIDSFDIKQKYCRNYSNISKITNQSPVMELCKKDALGCYNYLLDDIPDKQIHIPKRKIGFC